MSVRTFKQTRATIPDCAYGTHRARVLRPEERIEDRKENRSASHTQGATFITLSCMLHEKSCLGTAKRTGFTHPSLALRWDVTREIEQVLFSDAVRLAELQKAVHHLHVRLVPRLKLSLDEVNCGRNGGAHGDGETRSRSPAAASAKLKYNSSAARAEYMRTCAVRSPRSAATAGLLIRTGLRVCEL